mmetsp:Transcript_5714/g.7496  ORF Transcript_5714/g.7496 Transcript_5714/m.7496 type:complete len:249 (-) Transcript_5714:366-1112(-)
MDTMLTFRQEVVLAKRETVDEFKRNSNVVLNTDMDKDEILNSTQEWSKLRSNQLSRKRKLYVSSSSIPAEPEQSIYVADDSPIQSYDVRKKMASNECRENQISTGPFNPNWKSAYETFMEHVTYEPDGTCNCNGIFSRQCYEDWLDSRQIIPKRPEQSFRRALVGHVTGESRRKPFPPEIESCVLERLRERRVWECFAQDEESDIRIGVQGFRKMGYYESRSEELKVNTSPNSAENSLLIPLEESLFV